MCGRHEKRLLHYEQGDDLGFIGIALTLACGARGLGHAQPGSAPFGPSIQRLKAPAGQPGQAGQDDDQPAQQGPEPALEARTAQPARAFQLQSFQTPPFPSKMNNYRPSRRIIRGRKFLPQNVRPWCLR